MHIKGNAYRNMGKAQQNATYLLVLQVLYAFMQNNKASEERVLQHRQSSMAMTECASNHSGKHGKGREYAATQP